MPKVGAIVIPGRRRSNDMGRPASGSGIRILRLFIFGVVSALFITSVFWKGSANSERTSTAPDSLHQPLVTSSAVRASLDPFKTRLNNSYALFPQKGGTRTGSITASPNPIQVCDGSGVGVTTLTWTSTGTTTVEVHSKSPTGILIARTGPNGSATTGKSVTNGMVFYLQDVSGGLPLTSANTLSTVTVGVTTNGCSQSPIYEGFHDGADCTHIFGWAADRARLNVSINVDIYDGATLLSTVAANQYRADVGAYLGDNGLHGFDFAVPSGLRNGQPHSVTVKFAGTSTNLSATPKSITCSAQLIPVAATASNSYPGNPPTNVFDGSLGTMWNSGGYAPQWILLDLGQPAAISQMRLNIAQLPDGQTTHEIYGGTDPQALTLLRTLTGTTQSGQWLEPAFSSAAANIRYLKVQTTVSPSWVAWNEIEIYGTAGSPPSGSRSPHNATQTPWPVPSTNNIEAEDFDDWNPPKGEGHTYHDDSVGNDWGLYRPAEDVDIPGSSDVGGGYVVGNAHGGEWLEYTVNVTSSPVDIQVRVASGGPGGRFHIAFDGVDKTGSMQVPDTGSWGTWATLTASNVSLPLGQHIMRLALDQNGTQQFPAVADINYIRIVTPSANTNGATFVSQTVPNSIVAGQTYNVSVTMGNSGTTTWNSASLYRLGSQNPQDNTVWGTNRVALPAGVAPGAQVTFNFFITAPATPGNYNFQWRMVQDGVGSFGDFTPNVVVSVTAATGSRAPHNATQIPWPVPSANNIEVEDFDDWNPPKGEGHTYHDDSVGNDWGLYRPGEDVDIPASSDIGGGYVVGNAHGGEWLEYTVNVNSSPCDIQVRVASGGPGGRFHVAFDGVDKTGPMQVPDTGGWGNFVTLTASNVSLPLGQHIMRLALDQNGTQQYPAVADFNYIQIVTSGGTPNQPPTVSITGTNPAPPFSAPATITVNATGSDPDPGDRVVSVQFTRDGVNEGPPDTAAPYTVTLNSLPQGNYVMRAVATDTHGAATTSAPLSITVNSGSGSPPLQPPTDSLTANQLGRRTSEGNGSMRIFYSYDALGRHTQTIHKFDGTSYVTLTRYGYPQAPGAPGAGTVVSFQILPDFERLDYTYDASGAEQSTKTTPRNGPQQTIVGSIWRNSRGQTIAATYGNGAISIHKYNDASNLRLNQIQTAVGAALTFVGGVPQLSGGSTLQNYGYSFDNNNNVTGVADNVNPNLSATYSYDSLDELISMARPGSVTLPYAYDPVGNLVNKENPSGNNQTYGGAQSCGGCPPSRGPHALATSNSGAITFNYDYNGNLLSTSDGTNITWNAENMPVQVVQSSINMYTKFFLGESLWKKVEPAVTTYYLPSMRVENGQFRKFFGGFAERSPDGSLKFYHNDHLGSASLVTDLVGSVIRRQAYMPYGEDRAVTGSFVDARYQFNFKEREATGFYDYGSRLYYPVIGRFLSADSRAKDGLNRYAYVKNNPLRYNDPTGHFVQIPEELIKKFAEKLLDELKEKLKAKVEEKVKNEILRTLLTKGIPEALGKLKGAKGFLLSTLAAEIINPSTTVYTGDFNGRMAVVLSGDEIKQGRLGDKKLGAVEVINEEFLVSESSRYGKNARAYSVESLMESMSPERRQSLKGVSALYIVTFERPEFDEPTLIPQGKLLVPNKSFMELKNIELFQVGKEP